MLNFFAEPVDYLAIGHIASDLLEDGSVVLGGTVSYAALTARALGLRAGILTSVGAETSIAALDSIPIAGILSEHTTTFENISTPEGRLQNVHHIASSLHPYMLPEVWRAPAIVHFAPLLDEIDLRMLRLFPSSSIYLTPQGWLRSLDPANRVHPADWLESDYVLGRADAAVLSIEDVGHDESLVESLADACRMLVITEGARGCRLFQRGFPVRIPAPEEVEIDSTGAGDIFAAVFFVELHRTGDAEKAARTANRLAAYSVRRRFLDSLPTETEIYQTRTDERNAEWARYAS